MRFLTFETQGAMRPGLMAGEDRIIDLCKAVALASERGVLKFDRPVPETLLGFIELGDDFLAISRGLLERLGELDEAVLPANVVSVVAPIPRPAKNVFCIGRNYLKHIEEGHRAQKTEQVLPKFPQIFTKPPTAVIGPGVPIHHDPEVTQKLDYEVELAVVIGKRGTNISQAESWDHIFGYTIANDITARDLQRRQDQWFKGKAIDDGCPMGPVIVTRDELDVSSINVGTWVNGERRQDGDTADLIFPIPRLIEELSLGMTLEPGDIIMTGTPSGVGYAMEPPQFLTAGDEVTLRIEGIGELSNPIVGPREAARSEDSVRDDGAALTAAR